MKTFDKINFIGRIFIGIYFLITGICLFQSTGNPSFEPWTIWLIYFMGFWSIVGGVMLISGIKPRAASGVLALLLIIMTVVEISFFANTNLQQSHIFEQFAPNSPAAVTHWASQQIHLFLGKMAILGACLFIAGARKIPHCVFARSEDNMRNKYGK